MDIDATRAEAEAALREALNERPPLLAEAETTARRAHDVQHGFGNFMICVGRGSRHGQDLITPVIMEMVAHQRRQRDAAAAAATLAGITCAIGAGAGRSAGVRKPNLQRRAAGQDVAEREKGAPWLRAAGEQARARLLVIAGDGC